MTSATVLVCQTIYCWGAVHQSLFLLREAAELLARWRQTSAQLHYTYVRFNARGPHLLFIIRDSSVDRMLLKCKDLADAIDRCPSSEELTCAELKELHLGCRSTCLTYLDRMPGYGDNNTSIVSPAEDLCYSFFSIRAASDTFWDGITYLCDWAICHLREGTAAEGLGVLISAINELFTEHNEDPVTLWSAYARSLRPSTDPELLIEPLRGRLDANPALNSLFTLPKGNAEMFYLKAQAKKVLLDNWANGSELWSARELVHVACSQMGLSIRVELTIILAAIIHLRREEKRALGLCASH